jgi:hypothetical protein
MPTKTYQSSTMAQALAQVKRELGPDAVILRTRNERVGAVLGVGGRDVVQITATNDPVPTTTPALRLRRPPAGPTSPDHSPNFPQRAPTLPPADTAAGTSAFTPAFTPAIFKTIGHHVPHAAPAVEPKPPLAAALATPVPIAPIDDHAVLDLRKDLASIGELVRELRKGGTNAPAIRVDGGAVNAQSLSSLLLAEGLDRQTSNDLVARASESAGANGDLLSIALIRVLVARLVRSNPPNPNAIGTADPRSGAGIGS